MEIGILVKQASFTQQLHDLLYGLCLQRHTAADFRQRRLTVAALPHRGCLGRQTMPDLGHGVVYDQLVADLLGYDAFGPGLRSTIHGDWSV